MSSARGEFPDAAQKVHAVLGSFDFGTAALRAAVPSLRMTSAIMNCQCGKVSGLVGIGFRGGWVGAVGFVLASGTVAAGWSMFPGCIVISSERNLRRDAFGLDDRPVPILIGEESEIQGGAKDRSRRRSG